MSIFDQTNQKMQFQQQEWQQLQGESIVYLRNKPIAETSTATIYYARTHQQPHSQLLALKVYKQGKHVPPVLHSLQHRQLPNVTHIHKVKSSFILTQLGGRSLATALQQGMEMDWRAVLKLTGQVVTGMLALKQVGLLHGDIKPENVLLCGGVAKLCDLDFAIKLDRIRQNKIMVGTRPYMAPQILQRWQCSEASEVWSLGVTLYQTYFRKHPFPQLSDHENRQLNDSAYHNLLLQQLQKQRQQTELLGQSSEEGDKVVGHILKYTLQQQPGSRPGLQQLLRNIQRQLGSSSELVKQNPQRIAVNESDYLTQLRQLIKCIPQESKRNSQLLLAIGQYELKGHTLDLSTAKQVREVLMNRLTDSTNRLYRNLKRLGLSKEAVLDKKQELYSKLLQTCKLFHKNNHEYNINQFLPAL